MKKNVLLADNHREYVITLAEYLEISGFNVIKAYNPDQARQLMLNEHIHLAIIDVRLSDDDNTADRSGLELTKEPKLQHVPSIILTNFPTADDVRKVMRPGESNVVDYLFKDDGFQAIVDAVKHAFEKHIHINHKLIFDWGESGMSIPGLIGLLVNDESVNYQSRHDEIDDLLRTILYEYTNVHFVKMLWFKDNRVALLAQARSYQTDRVFVLTIGSVSEIENEKGQLKAFPDDAGEGYTKHENFVRQSHFAADLWRLGGAEFDQLETLIDAAAGLRSKFNNIIEHLLSVTISDWNQQREVRESTESIHGIYQKRYPIFQLQNPQETWILRINDIAKEARRLNLVNDMTLQDDQLIVDLPGRDLVKLPNPARLLFNLDPSLSIGVLYTQNSPGQIDPETILVNRENVTWLTDFSKVGEYPVWHDATQLETGLRFCFIDTTELIDIFDVEQQLRPAWPKPVRETLTTNPEWNKYINAILRVREYAYDNIHRAPTQYAICLFFAVLADLLEYDAPIIRSKKEMAAFIHRILLASMIYEDMSDKKDAIYDAQYPQLVVNEENSCLEIGTHRIDLTSTEFRLINYLYKSEGMSCSRELICRDVFGIRGHPSYSQLHGQIDTTLNRIRVKIEHDPKNPRYIITEYGQGIRLIVKPDNKNK